MPQKQWFGPSSLFYFIGRITSHLAAFLEHPPADYTIHFSHAGKSFVDGPGLQSSQQTGEPQTADCQLLASDGFPACALTAMQEEYFLSSFWQSYHCLYQIVDEERFREHYKSLWSGHAVNRGTRKPSALVDIMLALCMLSTSPPRRDGGSSSSDAAATDADATTTTAGRWHYQRCQTLLISELESPSLSTLQCHVFSVIYLCCASFQNMAHSTLALAVRTAHILGLHLEPPADLPRAERELRKRLWWTLYALESKTCMKLGRPWSAPLSEVGCSLPADDHPLALESAGSATLASGGVTWLTYTLQSTRLVLAARDVYVSFYDACARALRAAASSNSSSRCSGSIHDDPAVLDSCATSLRSSMAQHLDTWVRNVPDGLRNKRRRGGEPFSTDLVSPGPDGGGGGGMISLAIETFAPPWLQRQRLLTELLYHHLCVILYRPMISFPSSSSSSLPGQNVTAAASNSQACAAAKACARHAVALTHITHQALAAPETDLLGGWHEAFQWQWNAAITLIGFVLACSPPPPPHPEPESTSAAEAEAARQAIGLAIECFEMFARHFAVAARAVKVVGDLMGKVESLIGSRGVGQQEPSYGEHELGGSGGGGAAAGTGSADPAAQGQGIQGLDGMLFGVEGGVQDVLTGTMDVAFSVDPFNSFEWLQGGNMNWGDVWSFPNPTGS